jgi:hypothetical protein
MHPPHTNTLYASMGILGGPLSSYDIFYGYFEHVSLVVSDLSVIGTQCNV